MDNTEDTPMEGEALVKDDDLFPGCSNMDEFLQAGYPVVMEGIRSSNGLPQDSTFSYYMTFPEFNEVMKTEGKHIQDVMQKIVQYCGIKKQIANQAQSEKFDVVTDLNDKLLDRVVKNLSKIDGTRFNPNEDYGESSSKKVSGSWNKNNLLAAAQNKEREDEEIVQLVVQTRTIRPQVMFKDKIDNRNVPWIPKLKEKPNQLKQLALIVGLNDNGEEYYRHPYEYELMLWKPSENWLVKVDEINEPPPLRETPFVFVETEEQLSNLLEDLKKETIIGVDLEAHSYRSYMGFVCLMQLSTGDKDYLVDTLKLRHKMYILNDVFTDSKILKIFHGASNDIEWLQRDFNLYVVGMFDTFAAAKALDYAKLNLAYLLKKFCDVDANKKFQLFDWRIRPLPAKAVQYAREDTHYLPYIYKKLNNELIEKAMGKTQLLEVVFMNSCQTCQRVFMKPRWDDESHMALYRRSKRPFDNRQLFALKEIYKWRDSIARQEDESTGYVLPNHMMMQMCEMLPRELQGILACCNPIPPLLRQHSIDVHKIILRAKEQPLVQSVSEMEATAAKSSQFSASREVDYEIRLNTYVHDSVHFESRDDLPTILDDTIEDLGEPPVVAPKLSLFVKTLTPPPDDVDELAKSVVKMNFVPPYERYRKVLPYAIKEQKEQLEKEQKEEEERTQRTNEMQFPSLNRPTSVVDSTEMPSPNQTSKRRKGPAEPPTALITQAGARKKMKVSQHNESKLEEESELPLINASVVKKEEEEEEDPTNRVGICGGSISSQKPSPANQRKFQQDRAHSTPQRSYYGSPETKNWGPNARSPHTNQRSRQHHRDESNRRPPGNSDDFQPFDYESVNFNRFHSGSANRIPLGNGSQKKGGRKKNRQFSGKQFNRKRGGRTK